LKESCAEGKRKGQGEGRRKEQSRESDQIPELLQGNIAKFTVKYLVAVCYHLELPERRNDLRSSRCPATHVNS
jgi:hypothetical protein